MGNSDNLSEKKPESGGFPAGVRGIDHCLLEFLLLVKLSLGKHRGAIWLVLRKDRSFRFNSMLSCKNSPDKKLNSLVQRTGSLH